LQNVEALPLTPLQTNSIPLVVVDCQEAIKMYQWFVYIIESPSHNDIKHDVYEGSVLKNGLDIRRLQYEYNIAHRKNQFMQLLGNNLFQKIGEYQKFPILHFAMHGSPNGIELTDNTFLDWNEFAHLLSKIKLSIYPYPLIICMSSCWGSFARQMAMRPGDLPFDILVGNNSPTDLDDLAIAYLVFYNLLFDGVPIQYCLEIMKLASNNFNFEIHNAQEVQKNWQEYQIKMNQNISEVAREIARQYLSNRISQ